MRYFKTFSLILFLTFLARSSGQIAPFVANGVFVTTSQGELPKGLNTWGSWVNGDDYVGESYSAWQPVTMGMAVCVAGYPSYPGMALTFEWRLKSGQVVTTAYGGKDGRESWLMWPLDPPSGATEVRWHAVDNSKSMGGWFGVSAFCKRPFLHYFNPRIVGAFAAFVLLGLLLALVHLAVRDELERNWKTRLEERARESLAPIFAYGVVSLFSYVLFWCWYAGPRLGLALTAIGLFASAQWIYRSWRCGSWRIGWILPHALAFVIGLLYLTMLVTPTFHSFREAGSNRFVFDLPMDNGLPGYLADRLFNGTSTVPFIGDWLASDRPPLQSSWILWVHTILPPLPGSRDCSGGITGIWFQLSWVSGVWCLSRTLGFSRRKASCLIFALVPLGFLLINTVYVWPKLSAATLVVGAFCLLLERSQTVKDVESWRFLIAGALLALGDLSHGGVAFAVLGAAPLVLWTWRWWRSWLVLGATCAVVMSPWIAYQKLVDPPANRLFKWHLAGVILVDERPLGQTLVEEYTKLGWKGALEARVENVAVQFSGNWKYAFEYSRLPIRRRDEMFNYLRSLSFYAPFAALTWLSIALRRRSPAGIESKRLGLFGFWLFSTWIVWILLMFLPDGAIAHQGSYTVPLLLYVVTIGCLLAEFPRLFWLAAGIQWIWFFAIWAPITPEYQALLMRS